MKNIYLLPTLLVFSFLLFACEDAKPKIEETEKRSKIPADVKQTGVQPCSNIFEYQMENLDGKLRSQLPLKDELAQKIIANFNYEKDETTLGRLVLNVRFFVNCKGKASWFRTTVVKEDFKLKAVSLDLQEAAEKAVMAVDSWPIKTVDGESKDHYVSLSLEVLNGQLNAVYKNS